MSKKVVSLTLLLFVMYIGMLPVQAMAVKVVVDPGHGGSDPGAIGVNGLYEKKVNTDIALKLRQELLNKGYDVVMTKDEEDAFLSLAERVEMTNRSGADLFVSVHANSYPGSSDVNGSMVLYYDNRYPQARYPASEEMQALTPSSRQLAQTVLDHMLEQTKTANKGIVPSAAYVIRMGKIPSILVETAFLSNPHDAKRLADEQFRQQAAIGIANGIEAFLPPVFPDLAGHWAKEHVLRLKTKGIVEGENNKYEPERALTRAEWITVLDRLFDLDAVISSASPRLPNEESTVTSSVYHRPDKSKPLPFKDITDAHWAYPVMLQAHEAGLLEGYPDGTLQPDRPVTRSEVAVLLYRLIEGEQENLADTARLPFRDVPAAHWSTHAINRLYAEGIITGMTENTFRPERNMTRAEMAAMIDRYNGIAASVHAPDTAPADETRD